MRGPLASLLLSALALAGPPLPIRAAGEASSSSVLNELPSAGLPKLDAMQPEERMQAATQAAVFWIQRKELAHGEAYLAYAERLPEANRDGEAACRLASLRAHIATIRNDVSGALSHYGQALERLPTQGFEEIRLGILLQKVALQHSHGFLADALRTTKQIHTVAEARGDHPLIARNEYERGMLFYKLGRLEEAENAASRAHKIFAELALATGLAECEKLLGNLSSARGKNAAALTYYESAFAAFKAAGNFLESANCRLNAAIVHGAEGRRAQAETYLDEAKMLFTQAASLGGVGLCHLQLGMMELERGDYLKAARELHGAEKMFTETKNLHRLAQTKQALASLYKRRGDISKAADYITEANAISEQVNRPR